jgi:hypothetical protein
LGGEEEGGVSHDWIKASIIFPVFKYRLSPDEVLKNVARNDRTDISKAKPGGSHIRPADGHLKYRTKKQIVGPVPLIGVV